MKSRQRYIVDKPSTVAATGKAIGIMLPFNTTNGVFKSTYVTMDQVVSNLQLLLLTAKGERYGQPDYGTDLRTILFEPVTDEEQFIRSIESEIGNAINYWMPYVGIRQLVVELHPDIGMPNADYAIQVKLSISISSTRINREVVIFITDTGKMQLIAV